ncbi:MAG: prohibitin family protein [Eubacteriales bacterium]|nr:prohibitin family protein [Eubacteriales bacterium]
MKRKGLLGGIVLALVIIIGVIMLALCTVRVPAGYVAVQYNMNGGVKDEVLTQGWHLVSPTTKTTLYTIGIEQSYLTAGDNGDSEGDESFTASSSEGKAMTIDLTFTYQYQAENVTDVFTRFKGQSGKDVRDSFIKPNIVSWTKEVIARYKVSDILGEERANVNLALSEYLSEKFEKYGITISNVSLINIEVDEETRQAISAKITAQQNADTQAINNQTAIDKAEAEAQVKRTEAQASADAKLIEAEAEAEANRLLQESLNGMILQQEYIDRWNGELPDIVTGDSSTSLMIPSYTGTDAAETEE